MPHLALDDLARAISRCVGGADASEDVDGVADGAEGITQLVTQHGQELVLGAARRFRLDARELPACEELRVVPLRRLRAAPGRLLLPQELSALLFRRLSLGDVEAHAGHPLGTPRAVGEHFPAALHPADDAVRP